MSVYTTDQAPTARGSLELNRSRRLYALLFKYILHRHLAPPRTDFEDIRTALRFVSSLQFFLVSVIVISLLLSFSISCLLSLPLPSLSAVNYTLYCIVREMKNIKISMHIPCFTCHQGRRSRQKSSGEVEYQKSKAGGNR